LNFQMVIHTAWHLLIQFQVDRGYLKYTSINLSSWRQRQHWKESVDVLLYWKWLCHYKENKPLP
jgi:hypothetical protein